MFTLLPLLLITGVVSQCPANQIFMKFTKISGSNAQDESFYIWNETAVVYSSPPFASSGSVSFEHCFEPTENNQYRIQFVDSSKDSWDPDSLVQIEGIHQNIVFINYMTELEQEFFPLSLYNPVSNVSLWKFSQSESAGWTTTLFDDSEWVNLDIQEEVPRPESVQYYRVSFTGITSMAAYEVQFNYRHGIVAYINGLEIYRDNMPTGLITNVTYALGSYEHYAFRGTLRSAVEVTTDSVLSVEIHMQQNSNETVREFDAWLSMYAPSDSKECFVVPYSATITASGDVSVPERLFDFSLGTFVYSSTFPVVVDYYFPGNVIPVVNGIRIYAQASTIAVQSFSFTGSANGNQYSSIVAASDIIMDAKKHTSWSTYNQQSLWRYYRGSFSRSGSVMYLYEVQPAVCNTSPVTSILFPQSGYSFYVNDNYLEIKPSDPLISNCTLISSLPSGLSFNNEKCTISGVPTSVFPNTTITINSSVSGGISGSIWLQVVHCTGKMIEILRTYKTDATFERYTIWNEDTKEVLASVGTDNNNPNNQDVTTHICLTVDRIGIEMGEETSWAAMSYLYVNLLLNGDDKEIIVRARRDSALNLPNYYIVSLKYMVQPGDEWLYMHSQVPENWYDASVTTGWNNSSFGLFPDSTNRIQLYKKTFNIDSLANITSFSINVRYCYAILIFVNNMEVLRYGIEGELTSESQATTSSYYVMHHMVTLPVKTYETAGNPSVNYIVQGSNTIAIAIVSVNEDQVNSLFDCTVRLISRDEHSRVFDYDVLSSGISGTNTYPFDHYHGYTISNSGSIGNSLTLEFRTRREWINQIVISNDLNSNDYNVESFNFFGKNPEDSGYTQLKTVTGLEWTSAGQTKRIWVVNNKPYNRYRWATIKTQASMGWKISMLDVRIEDADMDIPPLSYTSPLTVFNNIEMAEEYPNSEFYTSFTVNPPLPAGLTIDYTTGMISGTATEVGSGDYVIQAAKVTGGNVTFTLHLVVSYCTGGRSLITMTVRTDFSPSEGLYVLYSGRGTSGQVVSSITSFSQYSSVVYYDFCLPDGLYTMQLKDKWGDGWYNPAGIFLSVDVGEFRFEVEQIASLSVEVPFSSYLPFQSAFTEWKIQRSEVSGDWTQVSYDDAEWELTKAGEIGTVSAATTYLRHHFSIPSLEDYPMMNVMVKFGGGLVAYLNGHKVARFNLPSDVTPSMEAPAEHDATRAVFFHVIMSMVDASTTDNVIAIELHRAVDTSSSVPVVFYATGVFGVNDCSIARDSFISVTSTALSDGETGNFFDISQLTSSTFQIVNSPYIEWQVENLEGSRFNGYGILSGNGASMWGFTLYGNYNETNQSTLHHVTGEDVKSRIRSVFESPSALIGYSSFRWQIDVTPSSGTIPPISELMMLYCKGSGSICKGDDTFPSVYSGQFSPSHCAEGLTGYLYKECIDGEFGEIKTDKCVYNVPRNIQYQTDSFVFVKDIPVVTDAPTYENIILEWYVLEGQTLPAGLSLDGENGIISGKPTGTTEQTMFTIVGKNPAGVDYVVISIEVRLGECRADDIWPTTPVGSEVTFDCNIKGNYVGRQTRSCVLGQKDGEWNEVSGICISYLTFAITVAIVVVVLVVVIILLVTVSKKRKAVGGTKRAKKTKGEVQKKSLKV